MPETGYLAPEGFTAELQAERGPALRRTHGRLAVSAVPGARLVHLHHNKQELTWLKLE